MWKQRFGLKGFESTPNQNIKVKTTVFEFVGDIRLLEPTMQLFKAIDAELPKTEPKEDIIKSMVVEKYEAEKVKTPKGMEYQ